MRMSLHGHGLCHIPVVQPQSVKHRAQLLISSWKQLKSLKILKMLECVANDQILNNLRPSHQPLEVQLSPSSSLLEAQIGSIVEVQGQQFEAQHTGVSWGSTPSTFEAQHLRLKPSYLWLNGYSELRLNLQHLTFEAQMLLSNTGTFRNQKKFIFVNWLYSFWPNAIPSNVPRYHGMNARDSIAFS